MSANSNEERDNVAWGGKYCNYVSEASKNDTLISIPCYGGAAMKLREKDGFSGISFMTSELYNLPWVWYFCDIDGKEVVVKQACFTQEQISECSGQTATQFIKNIAPEAPNSGNLAQFPAYE